MIAPLAIAALVPLVAAETYPIVDSFKGTNFLDGWRFPASKYDNTTSGDVFWATKDNTSLLYTNDAGRFVMKVDNTSFVPYNEKRYAPLLLTKRAYPPGTVWVMDAVHMPYGCSVWPALWTQGPNWPAGGEIDIMEGVNQQTANQIALHTAGDGCYASQEDITGTLKLDNCSITANSGSGCTTGDPNSNSYGAAFAAAGGGVYVTEFTEQFIKVWFKSRADIPSTLTADSTSLDTSTLGKPTAWYGNSKCDIPKYFGDQTLTIDITLCGVWGGAQSTLEQTCPALVGTNTCYTTYVINDASATYANAYFEINYVNVFSNSTTADNSSSPSASASGPSGSSSGSAKPTGSGTSGARRNLDMAVGRLGWAGAVAGAVAAGVAFVL